MSIFLCGLFLLPREWKRITHQTAGGHHVDDQIFISEFKMNPRGDAPNANILRRILDPSPPFQYA